MTDDNPEAVGAKVEQAVRMVLKPGGRGMAHNIAASKAGVPVELVTAAVRAEVERRSANEAKVTPVGQGDTPVPRQAGADQPKGHSDTSDTDAETEAAQRERLLGAIRTGKWLDAQTFPPLRFAVPDLVPEGFALLVGPPKVGKSWLIASLLLAVASGGRALGGIPINGQRPVLYLALEDGDRRMQSRCRKLLLSEPLPELFHYVTRVAPCEILLTIDTFLVENPTTALVVIDTLGKVMPPAGPQETTYQRDYRVGGKLKDIADARPGLALVVIHHDRKAQSEDFVERVSGTNGLAGSADTVIVLSRKRQSTDGLLMVTGRDVPEAEYALEMVEGINWRLDGADLAGAAKKAREREESASGGLSDRSAEMVEFVRLAGPKGRTTAEVVAKFGEDARKYLTRRVDDGRLLRAKRGTYVHPSCVTSDTVSLSNGGSDADQRRHLRLVSDARGDTVPNRDGPDLIEATHEQIHPCPDCRESYDSIHHQIDCEGLDAP